MPDELSPEAAEAIHKATSAAQAVEISREVQINNAIARHEETVIAAVNVNYTSIMTTLATLVAGQNTTNEHFARINGSVAEQQKDISMLKLWRAELKGVGTAFNMFGGAVWSVVLLVIGATVYWLFKHIT